MELEQGLEHMKAPWNPADRFEIFCKRFGEAIIFTAFVGNDISIGNATNLLLNTILKMSVFQTHYKEWNGLLENKCMLVSAVE